MGVFEDIITGDFVDIDNFKIICPNCVVGELKYNSRFTTRIVDSHYHYIYSCDLCKTERYLPLRLAAQLFRSTPLSVMNQTEFETPEIITPDVVDSFDDLLKRADDIRNLKLVPVKSVEAHAEYNSLDKKQLISKVKVYLKASDFYFNTNDYPYWLPHDVRQEIIWINNNVDEQQLKEFIYKNMIHDRNITEYIAFERPLNITTKLIKGTIPQIRHIHFWSRVSNPWF